MEKLIFTGREPLEFDPTEQQMQSVRIGVHLDAPVFWSVEEKGVLWKFLDPVPIIDQVLLLL